MASLSPQHEFQLKNPEWIAHRYDRKHDAVHFRHVTRQQHASVPFVTDDYLGQAPDLTHIIARNAVAENLPQADTHFIFHSAFCNSTLLCRALDAEGIAMAISEPAILNDMVGLRRRGEVTPQQLGALTDQMLRLLSRRWGEREAVILKPSSIVNPLAAGLLTLRPKANAILLYAPLKLYLNSVARKGLWCRLWARELFEGLLTDGVADFGFTPAEIFRQSDLQIAALGWLAQHRIFANLMEKFGSDRLRWLDSEHLLSDRRNAISSVVDHFRLTLNDRQIQTVIDAPTFRTHSKSGKRFSHEERRLSQERTAEAHGDEIDKVHLWAVDVAKSANIELR
jgi:hypothetical protein